MISKKNIYENPLVTRWIYWFACALFFVLLGSGFLLQAQAKESLKEVVVSAKILNKENQPVADDLYDFVFTLYKVDTNRDIKSQLNRYRNDGLWRTKKQVFVEKGELKVSLKVVVPEGDGTYSLGIKIDDDREMLPRKIIFSGKTGAKKGSPGGSNIKDDQKGKNLTTSIVNKDESGQSVVESSASKTKTHNTTINTSTTKSVVKSEFKGAQIEIGTDPGMVPVLNSEGKIDRSLLDLPVMAGSGGLSAITISLDDALNTAEIRSALLADKEFVTGVIDLITDETPDDEEIIIYDEKSGKYTGATLSFDLLTDIALNSLTDGDRLVYNKNDKKWKNLPGYVAGTGLELSNYTFNLKASLNNLTDVDISGTPSGGQVLTWSGGKWIAAGISPSDTIYTADGVIGGDRNVSLGGNNLSFGGNDLFIDGNTNNIGVGTTTPSYKLDVAGEGRFSGDLTLSAGLLDKDGDIGGSGQILTSTGSATDWVDVSTVIAGAIAIDNLTDAQNDAVNNNLFLGQAGFSGTFYNEHNTVVGVAAFATQNTVNSQDYYGDDNTVIGYQALQHNTLGYKNSAMGVDALQSNAGGYENSAVGVNALYSNTGGYQNTAVGVNTLYSNTFGRQNSALGINALYSNVYGSKNVAIGESSLYSNVGGSFNSAIGSGSLQYNTTGYSNTGLGVSALFFNTTGKLNTAIGASALVLNNNGDFNTGVGNGALFGNSSGSYNVGIGTDAGRFIADGTTLNDMDDYNIYIGTNSKSLAGGSENEIVIGYNAVGVGSNSVVLGNDSIQKTILKGSVGIGTTTPSYKLDVAGEGRFSGDLTLSAGLLDKDGDIGGNGQILTSTGSATDWVDVSTVIAGAIAIDNLTDAQNDAVNNNLFLGQAGFSGTFYNEHNTVVGVAAFATQNTVNSQDYYGDDNTVIGYQALQHNTLGYKNSAMGSNTLQRNVGGYENSALGANALYSNTGGHQNAAVGVNTLYSNTFGCKNSALGINALYSNVYGSENVAIGENSLYANVGGNFNSALGVGSLRYNTHGYSNTGLGASALFFNTTGKLNTAIGASALVLNNNGDFNTGVGNGALFGNSSGSYNVGIGTDAGRFIADGTTLNDMDDYNIYIGTNSKSLAGGSENEIVIGYNAVGVGSNSVVLGNDSIQKTILKGSVGIGTTSPSEIFTVYNGSTTGTYTTSGWVHSSDERLKTNIEPIKNALTIVNSLEGVLFNWKTDPDNNQQIGFVAQAVKEVLPQVVVGNKKDGYGISYGNITALNLQAIKELNLKTDNDITNLAELQKSVDENLLVVNKALTTVDDNVNIIGAKIDDLKDEIDEQKEDVNKEIISLKQQMEELKKLMPKEESSLEEVDLEDETSEIAYLFKVLGLDPNKDTGIKKLTLNDLEVGQELIAKNIKAENIETEKLIVTGGDGKNLVKGEAVIPAGKTTVEIETTAIEDKKDVYITPTSSTYGEVLYVGKVVKNKKFEIKIDEKVEEDISLNWWIIGEK